MTPPISIYGPGPLAAPSGGCVRGGDRPLMDFYFSFFFFPLPGDEQHHLHPLTLFFSFFSSRRRSLYAAPVCNLGFGLRGKKRRSQGENCCRFAVSHISFFRFFFFFLTASISAAQMAWKRLCATFDPASNWLGVVSTTAAAERANSVASRRRCSRKSRHSCCFVAKRSQGQILGSLCDSWKLNQLLRV